MEHADASAMRVTTWAQRLGETHRDRDERATQLARVQQAEAAKATGLSIERWASVVAAIRRLADAYNTGAQRIVLTVVEEPGQPAVTITPGSNGTAHLIATLEDACISMRARDEQGTSYAIDVPLRSERDDDATAAYLLQNWMQHL
jgi:hypothetical protein